MKDEKFSSDGVVVHISHGNGKNKSEAQGFESGGKSELQKQLEREGIFTFPINLIPYIKK